ncbi:MAG: cyclase family protein [Candidatus Gracilibacteria bacterium]
MKYIDLTHTFTQDMPVYPNDPKPKFKQTSYINKNGYNEFQIKTNMHVGTHMDAPLHMINKGKNLCEYPPEHFFGKGHLIDARNQKSIDAYLLKNNKISKGDIVFIMTGFYKKFNTPEYYKNFPVISDAFTKKIIKLGVKIIGMDTPSPDKEPFAIHKLLLKNDVLIIENLTNLELLLKHTQFNISALPAKFETEAAPIRVIAQIK